MSNGNVFTFQSTVTKQDPFNPEFSLKSRSKQEEFPKINRISSFGMNQSLRPIQKKSFLKNELEKKILRANGTQIFKKGFNSTFSLADSERNGNLNTSLNKSRCSMNVSKFNFKINPDFSKSQKKEAINFEFKAPKPETLRRNRLARNTLNYSMNIQPSLKNPFTQQFKIPKISTLKSRPARRHVNFFNRPESKTNQLVQSLNSSRIVSPTLGISIKNNFYTPQLERSPEKSFGKRVPANPRAYRPASYTNILNFSFKPKQSSNRTLKENIGTTDTQNSDVSNDAAAVQKLVNPFEGLENFQPQGSNAVNSSRTASINFDFFNN